MEITSFDGSTSLRAAAQCVRMLGNQEYYSGAGGAPCFKTPNDIDAFLERTATVFDDDGNFSGQSLYAEKVAICLHENSNPGEALHLFRAITEGKEDILFVNPPKSTYPSESTSKTLGLLGYEGVYRFGLIALANDDTKLAKRLFLELIEKTPVKCYPIRLSDIRVGCLKHLRKMGVKRLENGHSLAAELEKAEAHQY